MWPSEDPDQPGRAPSLIRVFPMSFMGSFFMQTAKTLMRLDAQSDVNLCWAHMSFCWFCHAAAQMVVAARVDTGLVSLVLDKVTRLSFLLSVWGVKSSAAFWKISWYDWKIVERKLKTKHTLRYEPHHAISNNKGADQPVLPHSLISAFVVRCLDSIIPLLATAEISRLAGLCGWAGWFES